MFFFLFFACGRDLSFSFFLIFLLLLLRLLLLLLPRLGQSMDETMIQKCGVLLEERESWLDTCVEKGTMKNMLGRGTEEKSDRPTKRQKK